MTLEDYRARWQAFVHAWSAAAADERERLVSAALADGLPPAPAQVPPVDEAVALDVEVAVIRAGASFDMFGYMWHNPDLHWNLCGSATEEVRHFVRRGWHELRHPTPGFDIWHYQVTHLDPTADDVNPLVHYELEGRRAGLSTLPSVEAQPPPEPLAGPVRRVCLFAGFDVDGVVDPTVVAYVAELSRFADVYYLADCPLEDGELDKLAPYTRGAWAIRHGRYDFGSYSMLATELVGWDVIDTYDELLLVNDSGWLVQPLDRVFARMEAAECDWWGLQATYEDFGVDDFDRLGRPLSLDEVEEQMRRQDLWRYSDFIHVGSYFLAYRRRVVQDPEFRRRLGAVTKQRDKTAIILKYEIGFSRLLILRGYHLATFVDGILPYHPVYRESAFELMRDGFPLLKRQFLYENPFSAPDLRRWKERVLEVVPDADVEAMERNLRRVAPPWSLHRSFAITSRPDGTVQLPAPLDSTTFPDEDKWVPSFDHWWGFPVDPRTGLLSGAVRAVFDTVREDPSVKKIVFEGSAPVSVSGFNVVRVPTESPQGQMYALRLGTVFTSVGPRSDVNHPLSPRFHRFVQLGRPTGLVSPEVGLSGSGDAWGLRDPDAPALDDSLTRAVVTSAPGAAPDVERFPRLEDGGTWETGSPRLDLLLRPEVDLAPAHRVELDLLRALLDGRRLVVVEPWDQPMGHDLLDALASWTHAHDDVAVGLRRPGEATSPLPEPLLDLAGEDLLDRGASSGAAVLPETAWRLADVLVSGSAADLADWAVLDRPAVNLSSDRAVPLPRTRPTDVVAALEAARAPDRVCDDYHDWGRSLHLHSDGHSAERVVLAVKRTYQPIDEWLAEDGLSPST